MTLRYCKRPRGKYDFSALSETLFESQNTLHIIDFTCYYLALPEGATYGREAAHRFLTTFGL